MEPLLGKNRQKKNPRCLRLRGDFWPENFCVRYSAGHLGLLT